MEYAVVVNLVVDILKSALPIGIVFIIAEKIVQLFLHLAFPKVFKS